MRVIEQIRHQKLTQEGWPKHLYKYRSLRSDQDLQRIKRILDGFIYAAHRNMFNDPFDCAPVAEIKRRPINKRDPVKELVFEENRTFNRATRRRVLSGARRSLEGVNVDQVFKQVLDANYNQTGIVSLSSKPDDILMWGHYASDHTGVCLRLNIEDKGNPIRYAYPIRYTDERPIINYPFNDEDDVTAFLEAAFLVKAQCWQYESEWRVLFDDGPGEKSFRPTSANGLIFGARTPEKYIQSLVHHIECVDDQRSFAFCRASLDQREFRINIEPGTAL